MYPFGHGLSYTQFKYSTLSMSSKYITRDGTLLVSVDVQNTGARMGEEVVQIYTRAATLGHLRSSAWTISSPRKASILRGWAADCPDEAPI